MYRIELTPPAEKEYKRLYHRAQVQLNAGHAEHPAVITFNALEEAMDSILAENPCDPAFALTGIYSNVYKVSLDSISISYRVNRGKEEVIVRSILQVSPRTRQWLMNAIENGTIDNLLATLKIDKPGCKSIVTSSLLH